MTLKQVLRSSFAERMTRLRAKNAPEFAPPVTNSTPEKERRSKSENARHRKWLQARAMLALSPVLPSRFAARMRKRLEKNAPKIGPYESWIKKFDTMSEADRKLVRGYERTLRKRPKISIIMPVYNTPEQWLQKAIDSVRNQLYENWELCIADDASTAWHVKEVLSRNAMKDARIKVCYRKQNGHISATSNDALKLATGEYVGLLDHDDELHEAALFYVVQEICQHPSAGIIFSDEDKIDTLGRRKDPYFKCGFSYDLFLAQNLINHFGVYKRRYIDEVGGFHASFEGSQDWDLALRVIEKCGRNNVRHIPRVLYHWRMLETSTSTSLEVKPYARLAGIKAVEEHLRRVGVSASVTENINVPSYNRAKFSLPCRPLASIIIPTYNGYDILKRCISSIFSKTDYKEFEIILVNNNSDEKSALNYMNELKEIGKVNLLDYKRQFNYSAINNYAVSQAKGEVLILLNNDTEVISPEWLTELISHALRRDVGAVGALLLYPDSFVQHAGVIVGLGGVAGHAHPNFPSNAPGYFGHIQTTRDVSAVTGACLAVRKDIYYEVGGLDEDNLPVAFNDIDFCLRVGEKGYKNIYTPFARLYHHESKTRGLEDTPEKQARFEGECNYMRKRHSKAIASDPFYNPNLSIVTGDYSLSFAPKLPRITDLISGLKELEKASG